MSKLQQPQFTGADELLRTKLRPPRLPSNLMPRESLSARLDEGLDRKLTLLSAPAGFGKTTLIRQWLEQIEGTSPAPGPQTAWVSLDAGDNDPVRFWRYIITACQVFQPDLGSAGLELLHTLRQPPFEAMLTVFINELTQLPGRFILVLEDYHVITSSQIHQTIGFLLDHLPGTLHLVLVTRSDPPLPLARLLAQACDWVRAVHELLPAGPQEQRVLRLLAVGLSKPEIAEELIISVNTVKTHVQNIYRKLDVHSREAAGDVARHLTYSNPSCAN